jgi:hypothetical protein
MGWDARLCWRNASAAWPSALQTDAVSEPVSAQARRRWTGQDQGGRVDACLRGCWWSARWLGGFFLCGVGEEVIDHPVQQGGELVQLLRGPVR